MKGRIKKFSLMIIIIVYVYISYEIILGYCGNLELVWILIIWLIYNKMFLVKLKFLSLVILLGFKFVSR